MKRNRRNSNFSNGIVMDRVNKSNIFTRAIRLKTNNGMVGVNFRAVIYIMKFLRVRKINLELYSY